MCLRFSRSETTWAVTKCDPGGALRAHLPVVCQDRVLSLQLLLVIPKGVTGRTQGVVDQEPDPCLLRLESKEPEPDRNAFPRGKSDAPVGYGDKDPFELRHRFRTLSIAVNRPLRRSL